jgi:hypothetical protein
MLNPKSSVSEASPLSQAAEWAAGAGAVGLCRTVPNVELTFPRLNADEANPAPIPGLATVLFLPRRRGSRGSEGPDDELDALDTRDACDVCEA